MRILALCGQFTIVSGCAHLDTLRACGSGAFDYAREALTDYKTTWCQIGATVGSLSPIAPELLGRLGCLIGDLGETVFSEKAVEEATGNAIQSAKQYFSASEEAVENGNRCYSTLRDALGEGNVAVRAYEERVAALEAERDELKKNLELISETHRELLRIVRDMGAKSIGDDSTRALAARTDELDDLIVVGHAQLARAAPISP